MAQSEEKYGELQDILEEIQAAETKFREIVSPGDLVCVRGGGPWLNHLTTPVTTKPEPPSKDDFVVFPSGSMTINMKWNEKTHSWNGGKKDERPVEGDILLFLGFHYHGWADESGEPAWLWNQTTWKGWIFPENINWLKKADGTFYTRKLNPTIPEE